MLLLPGLLAHEPTFAKQLLVCGPNIELKRKKRELKNLV